MSTDLQGTALHLLNQLLFHEPKALEALIEHRAPVSSEFADFDSPIVVQVDDIETNSNPQVGMLGIINGILGRENKIVAVFNDQGVLEEFQPFED
jgi:hypothetical protein